MRAYFDDALFALGGGHGDKAQAAMINQSGVGSLVELNERFAVHTRTSLFAQRSIGGEVASVRGLC